MKNKKGMTLIEVIVAIFLIGLIASSFLPSIMSSFNIMKKGKSMTVNTFKTQQNIELTMEHIRDDIADGLIDSGDYTSITAFGKIINGILIEEPIIGGNGYIHTLVASGHVVEENLPEVINVKLDQSSPIKIVAPKYVQGANINIKLEGNHDIVSPTNYFTDLKKWYVSNVGFDGYIPDTVVNESDWGTRYPSWPNDYTSIKDIDANILSMKGEYIGRHIVYSLIPVSKTGRYGLEIGSNPIYVNGPPILSNLSLHLDSYILDSPDEEVIKKWNDLSSGNYASTSGTGVKLNFNNGKYAIFDKSRLTLYDSIKKSNELTLFIVVQNPGTNINQELISKVNGNNGWTLELIEGKIEFSMNNKARKVASANVIDNNKYIITIKARQNNIDMIIDKDGSSVIYNESYGSNVNFNNINSTTTSIGNSSSDLNIAEIITYSSELSGDYNENDEVYKLRNYLAKKHRIELEP